ncbi:uncharacterized protein [Henckelia pumila]|uniref:uncharacterized protein n=1 Tax=Henckelia pumila TaxID=405737 RepID=UPI003C6DCE8C
MPGSNNDINVLEASNLFSNLAQGIAPPANYFIGGKEYHQGYYLADGIYPKWSTLVQTIHDPRGPKKKYFAMKQESCRKDVERAFGVLQSRFAIVASPARAWQKKQLHDIMTACIIMHNMIIEDERDLDTPIQDGMEAPTPNVEVITDQNIRFQEFLARYKKVADLSIGGLSSGDHPTPLTFVREAGDNPEEIKYRRSLDLFRFRPPPLKACKGSAIGVHGAGNYYDQHID